MLTRPSLKKCYHLEVFDPETVFLLGEGGHKILRGGLYAAVVPLLDGSRSVDEIIGSLRGRASAAEVMYALMQLESKGYVVEQDDETPDEVAAFWHSLGADSIAATRKVREARVSVVSLGRVPAAQMISALQSVEIATADSGGLLIALVDDYLQGGLEELNRLSLESSRPWMLVKAVGTQLWIGPIMRPGATGCWDCLAHRLRRNRQVEGFILRQKNSCGTFPVSASALNTTVQTALSMAATEALKWVALGANTRLEGRLLTLDTLSLELTEHVLTRRPRCPSCGDAGGRGEPPPVTLSSQLKNPFSEDGFRRLSAEETVAAYRHLVSPITGVVRTLQRLPDWDNGLIHNFYSGPNLALRTGEWLLNKSGSRSHSGGKGKSSAQAQAGALCEAVERYCWVFQGDEPRVRRSYEELGEQAIHPYACMNFSRRQYELRHNWNAQCSRVYFKVPEPFDESARIDWTPVWSLTHHARRYVPTLYCYCDYPAPRQFCYPDTNGNAAGSCIEEAILQGFLELVERDAVGIWWFNRLRRPSVDLSSFGEPYFESLARFYESLGRQMWVLDVTSDFGIPTFAAVSRRVDRACEEIIFGFGAHLSARSAVTRALTEMGQFLPLAHHTAAGDSLGYAGGNREMLEWLKTATAAEQPYLLPDPSTPSKAASDYPPIQNEDLRDDVSYCVSVARELGLDTLVLDQTRDDIGLKVVKVIVPGMRHFWRRTGPGRLYDVPVKMGWLDAPLPEKALNPVSVFF